VATTTTVVMFFHQVIAFGSRNELGVGRTSLQPC